MLLYLVSLNLEDRDWRAWVAPQPILTLFGVIIGFVVLGWQLKRQHANVMTANRRQIQDRLKLDLYDKMAQRIEATSVPMAELSLLPTTFVGELAIRASVASAHGTIPPSKYSASVGVPKHPALAGGGGQNHKRIDLWTLSPAASATTIRAAGLVLR